MLIRYNPIVKQYGATVTVFNEVWEIYFFKTRMELNGQPESKEVCCWLFWIFEKQRRIL